MNTRKRGVAQLIAIAGVLVIVFLLLIAMVFRRGAAPVEASHAQVLRSRSPFNGERAYEDLERVVAFGPRIPGSPELAALRRYIIEQVKAVGLSVREHAFDAETPIGTRRMVNIIATIKGTVPGVILLSNHYDTKYFPNFNFVGANDAGSTTAWMIEMARTLGPEREGRSIWLVWFDGEEAFEKWTETDSLYGSRALVDELTRSGELESLQALVNVDMIGDCDLGIKRDGGAPAWLTDAIWTTAGELDYSNYFLENTENVQDDHLPFRRAGVPAVDLIDFSYGGSRLEHERNWHTPRDTIDKVCAQSLQVLGDVVYHALPRIEEELVSGTQKLQ
jgi:glutaminyl-peptide cyclotransferase